MPKDDELMERVEALRYEVHKAERDLREFKGMYVITYGVMGRRGLPDHVREKIASREAEIERMKEQLAALKGETG